MAIDPNWQPPEGEQNSAPQVEPPQPFTLPASTSGDGAQPSPTPSPSIRDLASSQQPASAAPPSPGSVLRDYIKREGLDPGQATDEELAKLFVNGLPQIQHYTQMEQDLRQASTVARRYYENAGEFERWQQERDAAAQKPKEEPPKKWQAPEWNAEWEQLVKLDDTTGRYVPINPYINPSVADKVNAFVDHRKKFSNTFFTNPVETLREAGLDNILDEKLQNFREQIRQEEYAQSRYREAEAFIYQNYRDFYQTDQSGQLIYDSLGQPAMTPRGRAFAYYRGKAEESGIVDPVQQQDFARKNLRLLELEWNDHQARQMAEEAKAKKPAKQKQAEQPEEGAFVYPPQSKSSPQKPDDDEEEEPVDKKQQFLDRARRAKRVTPRDNSVSAAAEQQIAQNQKLSFTQMALAEAAERGELPQQG